MSDKQTAPSSSPFTWTVTAKVAPIVRKGSREFCDGWMNAVIGREVFVTLADGTTEAIGVVTFVETECVG